MSADQLIFQADHPNRQDEWLDFDNLFEFPSGYLDSNPTSVNSISPRDYDLSFTDADAFNWDSHTQTVCSQPLFPDFGDYDTAVETYGQPLFDTAQPMINPSDILQQAPHPSQDEFVGAGLDNVWLHDVQSLEDPFYSSVRQAVESQAAVDPRCFSQKEKRRDASIALHLQRLQDVPISEVDMPSDSSNGFSSPSWPDSPPGGIPPGRSSGSPATSSLSDTTGKSSPPTSGSESGVGSMQLVLDLNMNTTTNVPRKQKPRSKAQKENYIKARKYGVCEKHRKQHKRCNCLEKAATAHLNVIEPSCVAPKMGVGLSSLNPSLHVNVLPSQHSIKHGTHAVNSGQPRPQVKQDPRRPTPDLSPTQQTPQYVPLAGQSPVTTQTVHRLPPGSQDSGTLAVSYRYRVKQTTHTQPPSTRPLETRPRRSDHQPLETQVSLVSRGLQQGILQSQHTNIRPFVTQTRRSDHHPLPTQVSLVSGSLSTVQRSVSTLQQSISTVQRSISTVQRSSTTDQSFVEKAGVAARTTAIGLFSFWQGSSCLSSFAGGFLGRLVMFSSGLYMRSRKGMGPL